MKTKSLTLTMIAFFLISIPGVLAQDDMKTVFGDSDHKIDHGGYGAFTIGYSRIDKKDALVIGGRAGWLIDHHFTLGIAGYGFSNNISNKTYDNYVDNMSMAGGYGGVFLEYIILPNHPVHVAIPILFGAGGATSYDGNIWDQHNWQHYNYYYDGAAFLVFEPGVELELNIIKFFRVAFGVKYRLTNGINLSYTYYQDGNYKTVSVDPRAIDGFNYNISFKFGWF